MTGRRLLLAARRERLVQRAAQQRQELGVAAAPLAQAWVWVERGIAGWHFVRRRPWLVIAPVVLWAWWRPRGLPRALAGALAFWRVGRRLRKVKKLARIAP